MPRGNIKMSYYLCYGTPLCDRSLDRRVDSLRLEGQGRLDGWRMSFSRQGGHPNLEEAAGQKVWGCLFLVEESKLPQLDKEEAGGTRHRGTVYFEGAQVPCVWYSYPKAADQPGQEFLENLRSVYVQASLPQAQIDGALGAVKA
jgi:gamma-glutamylcyclotransferase (GGCT)/AIG2-like uncharacterized protein YtfP